MTWDTLRQEIVNVCHILDGMCLVEGFGHVSSRLPDGNILITAARGLGLAARKDLLIFNSRGELLSGEEGTAPLERWMHVAIYRARPDVNAICRTHSHMAATLGAAMQPVKACHGFGGMLGVEVPIHNETNLVTDDTMGQAVADTLGNATAVLLRGNGALVTGTTLPEACVRAIYLEEAAWIQVVGAHIGGTLSFTADELKTRSQWYRVELSRAWEYYSTKFSQKNTTS